MRVSPKLRGNFPGFAMGGLVAATTPNVGIPATISSPTLPGKTFDLVIGQEIFEGLYAPEGTALSLRSLARQSMRSAGRKPSWYTNGG